MAKKQSVHYVNNREFSLAVVDYVSAANKARELDQEIPIVPDYIARSFLRIAEGLSHKQNFIRYTYREEMVMDAVENCLKAIKNYDIDTATRSGNPNAFAYFTQISWYAFLRRIQKEKRQFDIKQKYLTESGIEAFLVNDDNDIATTAAISHFVDELKDRIDKVREVDAEVKKISMKQRKARKKIIHTVDSDLTDFIED